MTQMENKYGVKYDIKHLWPIKKWNSELKRFTKMMDITADGLLEAARPYLVYMSTRIVKHEVMDGDLIASCECSVKLVNLPKSLCPEESLMVTATGEEHERRKTSSSTAVEAGERMSMDMRRDIVRRAETSAVKRALKRGLGFDKFTFNPEMGGPTEEEEGTPLDETPSGQEVPEPSLPKPGAAKKAEWGI